MRVESKIIRLLVIGARKVIWTFDLLIFLLSFMLSFIIYIYDKDNLVKVT